MVFLSSFVTGCIFFCFIVIFSQILRLTIKKHTLEKEFIHFINFHKGLLYKICNLYCDKAEDRKDLFQEIKAPLKLDLIESVTMGCGNVILNYKISKMAGNEIRWSQRQVVLPLFYDLNQYYYFFAQLNFWSWPKTPDSIHIHAV